jgi:hypothetical protein
VLLAGGAIKPATIYQMNAVKIIVLVIYILAAGSFLLIFDWLVDQYKKTKK